MSKAGKILFAILIIGALFVCYVLVTELPGDYEPASKNHHNRGGTK